MLLPCAPLFILMARLSPAAREAAPAVPSGKAPTGMTDARLSGGALSGHIVSPDELREALSQLDKGQSAVEFELSEMHDAAEVGQLLSSWILHDLVNVLNGPGLELDQLTSA